MKIVFRSMFSWGVACLLLCAVGCDQPDYYQCDGTVTLDGTPIPNLQITFAPDNPDDRPPIAMTDASGQFQMSTGREMGVKPGSYKVIIEDPGAADGRKTSTEPGYVYVVERYSTAKSDINYNADHHESNYQLSLKKE